MELEIESVEIEMSFDEIIAGLESLESLEQEQLHEIQLK